MPHNRAAQALERWRAALRRLDALSATDPARGDVEREIAAARFDYDAAVTEILGRETPPPAPVPRADELDVQQDDAVADVREALRQVGRAAEA